MGFLDFFKYLPLIEKLLELLKLLNETNQAQTAAVKENSELQREVLAQMKKDSDHA